VGISIKVGREGKKERKKGGNKNWRRIVEISE
jgi:hypothetical protein